MSSHHSYLGCECGSYQVIHVYRLENFIIVSNMMATISIKPVIIIILILSSIQPSSTHFCVCNFLMQMPLVDTLIFNRILTYIVCLYVPT